MAVRRIRRLGDPVLRARCEPIAHPRSAAVRVIADDLADTLHDWQLRHGSGRGIAAPQIGAPVRMVFIDTGKPWVLVNPEIVEIGSHDFEVWDDCFSIPGLLVRVLRAHHVRVRYQDLRGRVHETEADGDLAELLQHEIDHLDGVLTVDRPHGLDPFCLAAEWELHHGEESRYGEPHLRSVDELVVLHA
jgi:peptide deformylase